MNPTLYARAKEVFLEVCDLPEGERAARLGELCGEGVELRELVAVLLRGDASPLRDAPAVGLRDRLEELLVDDEALPRIPGYTVLGRLGEGGMGTVYRAEQTEPVRRVVALKLMRSSFEGPLARARFQAERQALARLTHPNVATMYEAGATAEGFPYFVMELVDGAPLTAFCDERRLTVEQRMALFVAVCRGVEHAHRRGILHRDLKPSNVLVTEDEGRAVPKIIDFGVARIVDRADGENTLTVGGFAGTPVYMSPEALSASADLDTRTDVYSLGVLLHELLAGVPPHAGRTDSLPELIVRVTQTDPPFLVQRFRALPRAQQLAAAEARATDPSALARRLSGDLTWITSKATARARDERYGSAAELAEDLGRALEDLPVRAAPPSLRDRTVKLVRRHRVAVAAAALVLLGLVGGLIGLGAGIVRARQAQKKAEDAQRESQEVAGFFSDLFGSASPWSRSKKPTVRDLLVDAARDLPTRLADQPRVQAQLFLRIGSSLFQMGEHEAAEPIQRTAMALVNRVYGEDSIEASEALRSLAVTLYSLGTEGQPSHLGEAEDLFRRAIAIREKRLGHDRTEGEHFDLAHVLAWENRTAEAEASYRLSLEVVERRFEGAPADADGVVFSRLDYGTFLARRGCFEDAERLLTSAVDLAERTERDSYLHSRTLLALAELRLWQGRLEEAALAGKEALRIQERVIGVADPRRSSAAHVVGAAARDSGRLEEAEGFLLEAIGLDPDEKWDDLYVSARADLALLRLRQNRLSRAEELIEEARAVTERNASVPPLSRAHTAAALAEVRRVQGRRAEALASCRVARALRRSVLAPDARALEETQRTCDALATRER